MGVVGIFARRSSRSSLLRRRGLLLICVAVQNRKICIICDRKRREVTKGLKLNLERELASVTLFYVLLTSLPVLFAIFCRLATPRHSR